MQKDFSFPNQTQIAADLAAMGVRIPLYAYDICDSTNTRALELGSTVSGNFFVISAKQTAGRGRFERTWNDEKGKSICLSAFFELSDSDIKKFSNFALIAGVCICRAMIKYADADLKLKWPNDIYFEGKKLGGMIASLHAFAKRKILIFGIGVNFAPLENSDGMESASLLTAAKNKIDINSASAVIAAATSAAFERAKNALPDELPSEFSKMDFLYGKDIEINCAGSTISGKAQGIDNEGRLILKAPDGKILLAGAGESSILKR